MGNGSIVDTSCFKSSFFTTYHVHNVDTKFLLSTSATSIGNLNIDNMCSESKSASNGHST